MRIYYVTPDLALAHVGQQAYRDAQLRVIDGLGLRKTTVHRLTLKALARSQANETFVSQLKPRDALIVNGSSAFSLGFEQGTIALLSSAHAKGCKTVVLDAVIPSSSSDLSWIEACSAILVSDPCSHTRLAEIGARVHRTVPGLVAARFLDTKPLPTIGRILVTDYPMADTMTSGRTISSLIVTLEERLHYHPMASVFSAACWPQALSSFRSVQCVLSAQAEACYLAALTGRPFVMLLDTGGQMEAIRQFMGEFIPVLDSPGTLDAAIADACAHGEDFSRLTGCVDSSLFISQASRILRRALFAWPKRCFLGGLSYLDEKTAGWQNPNVGDFPACFEAALSAGKESLVVEILQALDLASPSIRAQAACAAIPVLKQKHCFKDIIALESLWNLPSTPEILYAIADAHFHLGRYESALARFLKIETGSGKLGHKAKQMIEWIRFLHGDFSSGWPSYPSKPLRPPEIVPGREHQRVTVFDARDRHELESCFGLWPWAPDAGPVEKLLVWLDFHASLGGEILATRPLRIFCSQFLIRRVVLAVDPRLEALFVASFPEYEVISKCAPRSSSQTTCNAYILARDIAGYTIKCEHDFRKFSGDTMRLPARSALPPAPPNFQPQIAFTWKTTNQKQGAYRNIPLDAVANIMANHDITYHSAQHGVTGEERKQLQSILGERIHFDTIDPGANVDSIGHALKQMNHVVTIDNFILHLCGALGIPAFVMLSIPSYWAWPASGGWSRWYDSLTLVRQEVPGHWQNILEALDSHLSEISEGNKSCWSDE